MNATDIPQEIIDKVSSPCYLIAEDRIEQNCQLLDMIQQRTGVKILLALKAFALPALFPLIGKYLAGVCASGAIEAQLGKEEFCRKGRHTVHTYSPAYTKEQMERVIAYSDHIIFNSIAQWHLHREAISRAIENGSRKKIGLRINPGYAEVAVDLYNPCLPGSRFGLRPENLAGVELSGITGFHFHALCEQGADVFVRVLSHFENDFSQWLNQIEWINFGGGHHITRKNYDVELLIATLKDFQKRYPYLQIYLEPGEAVVFNGGLFITTVLDILSNEKKETEDNIPNPVILDCSAETHMPDILAMPYRPEIVGAKEPWQTQYTYRLGGISCLAGDIIGDYSFPKPLAVGERLLLTDMALYSFVKNTTFNGVELPALYRFSQKRGTLHCIRSFGYQDYLNRIS